jgi:ATP-dependent Clp protease protease subunit
MKNRELYEQMEKSRIIVCSGPIATEMADQIMELLFIYAAKDSKKPINLYINSPGGSVDAGFEIIDTMQLIEPPVYTVATGICASMGAMILSAGDSRAALPHARIMIHQVSSGYEGKAADIETSAKETLRLNKSALTFLAENCGKTYEELKKDLISDHWMTAQEAVEYGIIDKIIESKKNKKGGKKA